MALIRRTLESHVLDALKRVPVVFVSGPRQAGKSTLVQGLAQTAWPAAYVTLDEASQLGAAQASPESFLRGYDGPLIIDEVQMVPDLFRALKLVVDELRRTGSGKAVGRYLLTGSANVMALPGLSDALVGRMAVLTLYPLSALEIAKGKGRFLDSLFANAFRAGKSQSEDNIAEIISRATFPEITAQDERSRRQWFESYVTSILQRDVRQVADIEKLGVLPNLLRVLASRAGGLINESDIARSVGLNAVTAKNYRILLRMMFLTFDVKPWFRNVGKRLVKSAKGYVTDTSLLCHLQRIDLRKAAASDPHAFGPIFENFVASELLKQISHSGDTTSLLHFRTSDGKEVDFLLEQPDGTLAGIEVKARDHVEADDFRGLKDLQAQVGKDFVCGIVIYRGRSTVPFGDKLWAVPASALWQ